MKVKIKVFLFFLLLISINACNSDRIFEEYQGMPDLTWKLEDTVSFEVPEMDPNAVYPAIGIRYNDTYEFNNLYIRYIIADSADHVIADSLINIHLFDPKTGRPLGDGFGNVYTKYDTLPRLVPRVAGKVKGKFVQYMRRDKLEGIEAIGLRINRE